MQAPESKINDQLAELLAGLSESQTKTIGEITILWNAVEHQFTKMIWLGADVADEIGEFITADLANVARINLARNLARRRFNKPRDLHALEYIETTIDLFDQCRIARNDIVHGLPMKTTETTSEAFQKRTARKAVGRIVTSQKNVSLSLLTELKSNLSALARHREFRFHLLGGSPYGNS